MGDLFVNEPVSAAALIGIIAVIVLLAVLIARLSSVRKEQDAVRELIKDNTRSFEMLEKSMAGVKLDLSNEVKGARMELASETRQQISNLNVETEQKLENIRQTMEKKITDLTTDNNRQLEQMRATVDEKLQKTLEDRLSQSFKLVSERLEEVYKGLGEMQNLAAGVGDLKRVLSNVKTRGILGEIQLSAILEQILSKEQYDENVATKRGSTERVEFAVKLPGDGESIVYLPIDAKFPADTYSALLEAYDTGDKNNVTAAEKALIQRLKGEAKEICEKYVYPPDTTDFAIMFLPVEGLYAEAVRLGMVETLQREYRVNIAGPTTMAALLNSLQMGFRTLAIQKHSSDVWQVLGAVKTEFDKFGGALAKTQEKLNLANKELDNLIGTRTNMIQRKLRSVQSLSELETREILGAPDFSDVMYTDDEE